MADSVLFNQPPAEFIEKTNSMIRDAVAQIGKGDKFLFVGVVNVVKGKSNTNFAAVQKVGDHVEIVEYIGKTWGEPLSAGIAGSWHF